VSNAQRRRKITDTSKIDDTATHKAADIINQQQLRPIRELSKNSTAQLARGPNIVTKLHKKHSTTAGAHHSQTAGTEYFLIQQTSAKS